MTSFRTFKTISVLVHPEERRLSRAPPDPARPRDRATLPPHSSPWRAGGVERRRGLPRREGFPINFEAFPFKGYFFLSPVLCLHFYGRRYVPRYFEVERYHPWYRTWYSSTYVRTDLHYRTWYKGGAAAG